MIKTIIANCGLFESEFLKLAGVSKQTLNRWNKDGAPIWVHSMLKLLNGNIPSCPGWSSCGGVIFDPDGNSYDLNEIRALFYLRCCYKDFIRSSPSFAINDEYYDLSAVNSDNG